MPEHRQTILVRSLTLLLYVCFSFSSCFFLDRVFPSFLLGLGVSVFQVFSGMTDQHHQQTRASKPKNRDGLYTQ